MTQPYYPPQQQMPPAMPQYPQQPYAQQQPMTPQYVQQPQQFTYPQQPMQPAPQPLIQGSLSDFFNQPSTGGGPVFSWRGKPNGTTYGGIVTRPITDADIQQQTMPGSNIRAYYRDGRAKFLMKVPLTVVATPEFPDGQAQWWVSGSARDELARAMAEVGCEANSTPEAGAAIVITMTGERPSGPGMNPSKTYRVQYRRPPGAPVAQPQQQQPSEWKPIPDSVRQQPGPIANTPAQVMQQMQPVMQAAQQQPAVPMPTQPQQQQPVMPQPAPVVQPVQQQPQQATSDLTAAQQQLLASLTDG